LLDIATSRLLASGCNQLSVFHAGGDDMPFGLIDQHGKPRPAYAVFADYQPLGERNGTRLDLSLAAADGSALSGVYAVAALHNDTTVTLLVNPSEVPALTPQPPGVGNAKAWEFGTPFFGKKSNASAGILLAPDAGRDYMGYHWDVSFDPAQHAATLLLDISEARGKWSLSATTTPDGNAPEVALAEGQTATGAVAVDLAALKISAPSALRFTLRARGPLTLANAALKTNPNAVLKNDSSPQITKFPNLKILLPLPENAPQNWRAMAAFTPPGGLPQEETPTLVRHPGHLELRLELRARTRVTLTPSE